MQLTRFVISTWYVFCLGIVGLGLAGAVLTVSTIVYYSLIGMVYYLHEHIIHNATILWMMCMIVFTVALLVANYTGSISIRAFRSINWKRVKRRIVKEVQSWRF